METFQNLKVWQEAHKSVLRVYETTKDFSSAEQFRLVDQICRAAYSIPANIAEGKGRKKYLHLLIYLTNREIHISFYYNH